jgi:(S)-2-hydroxyglutarate dehydrogenase
MQKFDVVVIGGGVVGLASAYNLNQLYPRKKILVVEKENSLAQHQTGHNSGVIHSGIYYKPGSLKAVNCRTGKQELEYFCRREGIPFETCGKVIVATHPDERERLNNVFERGRANGVACERIGPERLKELEPHVAGLEGLHVTETGIVDYRRVCERLAAILRERGQTVKTGVKVSGLTELAHEVVVSSETEEFSSQNVVNCGGLYCDRIAALTGRRIDVKIVPFRGEYFMVKPEAHHFCRNLIYPVPDPRFPFLGVHFTRMVSGHVECGPNAVLAFAREGYRKTDIHWGELFETLTFPGFIKMSSKYWQMGMGEMWRSFNKNAFVKALQRLIPEIQEKHLEPAPAGIRAQAVGRDGSLLDDFAIVETSRIVHVLNAPSPAATASLSIGKSIVERLAKRFAP